MLAAVLEAVAKNNTKNDDFLGRFHREFFDRTSGMRTKPGPTTGAVFRLLLRLFDKNPGDNAVQAALAATAAQQEATTLQTRTEEAAFYQNQFETLVKAIEAIETPSFTAPVLGKGASEDARALGHMISTLKPLNTAKSQTIWGSRARKSTDSPGRTRSSYHPYAYRPASLASSTSSDSVSD